MRALRVHLSRLAAIAVLTAVATACATTAQPAKPAAALPGKAACFFLVNFHGDWTVLDDSTLIVSTPPSPQAYLIKLFQPVVGLRFRQSLGFQDVEHTGQICNDSQDDLVVRGISQPPVPIVAVRLLTPTEQITLLKAAHQTVPRYLLKQAGSANGSG
ncbi:MAG TPA: DUF6491 family protein [Steroidobacteraceae bacterium]|jgi:hypothetical protein|nr:DUF6491 family protein [Steroidobacteraceae bacterium]